MKYLIILSILLASCSPCKYVAKHPECFKPDSVIINNEIIRYEKQFITNDSIIFDTIPCDPVENFVYKTRTIYKTNNKLIIDTIYQSKTIDRINPLNKVLEADNIKLENKTKNRNRVIGGMSLLIILLGLIVYIK